ncbi:MAG: tetratricopeptide repeat protein [Anaerolineaceae bacterium]|nr:tetratricopeptide repeat protein [Anaerolineaceae bacterium]
MSTDYLSVIAPFAEQVFQVGGVAAKKWRYIESFNVLRSLLRLLDNPDAIDQACFGLCGQAAFLRSWAYRDPAAVANFVIDLYMNGTAKIGDFEVSPDSLLLNCGWMSATSPFVQADFDLGIWGPGNPITESVWMICGGLANVTKNAIAVAAGVIVPSQGSEFDGWPASNVWTLALPDNIKTWMEKTGCYSSVADNTDVTKSMNFNTVSLANDALVTSSYNPADDTILCINTDMFLNSIKITPEINSKPPQFKFLPDHYVMLTQPITQSGGVVTMNIWTWGGFLEVQVSLNVFNDNYFGSIVGHAAVPRRAASKAPLMERAIRNQRIYFSQDKILHFNWECRDPRVEWFEIHRIGAGPIQNPTNSGDMMTCRDILGRVWPSSTPNGYQVDMDSSCWYDPADTRYEIVACHAALQPYDCDPFYYNGYKNVQCNVQVPYQYSGTYCETQTNNFAVQYDQVSTKHGVAGDAAITFGGESIGGCYQDGRMEIMANNAAILVGNKVGTPTALQKILVWLEYYINLFGQDPYRLKCASSGTPIEVLLGNEAPIADPDFNAYFHLNMPTFASDQDTPGMCLMALFSLEFGQYGSVPEWVFPAYASQVSAVQTPSQMTPDGFADFNLSLRPCEWLVLYGDEVVTSTPNRRLDISPNNPLNVHLPAAIFIRFGDKSMVDSSIKLSLTGQTPDGKTSSIQVAMTAAADHSYYYGWFQPFSQWNIGYALNLQIQGSRAWQSSVLKTLLGDAIDANPLTLPSLNWNNSMAVQLNYAEAGADCSRRIMVAAQSAFAAAANLPPDAFDSPQNNNSFAVASKISLVVPETPHKMGVLLSDQKIYKGLNFQDAQDCDYFDVSYQCPSYDDTDAANLPRGSGTNGYLGLTYSHQPPNLSCGVNPDDFRCMDVAVYAYDASNPSLYKSDSKSWGISIDSPARNLKAKQAYFEMLNHNFAVQGAFSYGLQFRYNSAYDSTTVNTTAPVFNQGRTTVARQLLAALYNRIDRPRPPEYTGEVISISDVAAFVSGYEGFLLDPATSSMMGQTLQKDGRSVAAGGLHSLGQLAQAFGRDGDALRIYRESATLYSGLGDKVGAVTALQGLASVYEKNGRTADLKGVKQEILKWGKIHE